MKYSFESKSKILSGKNALASIPFELSYRNVSRPLIIAEDEITKIGLLRKVIKAFRCGNIPVAGVYKKVGSVATASSLEKAREIYYKNQCDSIIAVGRSASIELAKILKYMIATGVTSYNAIDKAVFVANPPLFVVPTFLGSSKEATSDAVIYNDLDENKTGIDIKDARLQADCIFIDNKMLDALPPKFIITTSLDILMRSISAYIQGKKDDNVLVRVYAEAAIQLIVNNLRNPIINPKDREAMRAIVEANIYCGIAKENVKTEIVDILAKVLFRIKNIRSMESYAVLFIKNQFATGSDVLGDLLVALAGAEVYCRTYEQDRSSKALEILNEMYIKLAKSAGLAISLQDLSIKRDELGMIAEEVMFDAENIKHPVVKNVQDILNLLIKMY